MTEQDPLQTWKAVEEIRRLAPVVHNITNFVVMNNTANALLALGASPVMAHAEEEVADMVGIASSLVINIGTLSREWIKAMHKAGERALERGIPIVLDPVGAGATGYRTETARGLASALRPAIIRGNASEIMAVCGDQARTKGVDSSEASQDALAAARNLHETWGSTVCVSGATDFVVGGRELYQVRNGHPMMTRVTGLGCTASALCGAFAAVTPDPAQAAAQAMVVMGIAGELAAAGAEGPGTLQVRFLDALYRLTGEDILHRMRLGEPTGGARS
ncbi:MAG: hydroxyethylthiazole kinase [Holophaga sp.]|nr:hydroxyethylthiazole kinase [Holophaga sp.]